jgi:hypothetical protein
MFVHCNSWKILGWMSTYPSDDISLDTKYVMEIRNDTKKIQR